MGDLLTIMALAPRLTHQPPTHRPTASDNSDTYQEPTLTASGKPADIARKLADELAHERLPTHDAGDLACLAARAYESAAKKHKNPDYRYRANQAHPAVERTLGEWLDWLFALQPGGEEFSSRLAGARQELADRYPTEPIAVEQPVEDEPPLDPRYARARESLTAFAQMVKAGGKRFRLRPVTRLIIAKLEQATFALERGEQARLVVCVPPRVGKTQLVSRIFPAWFMGRNPTMSTMLCSHSTRYAAKLGMSVRNNIKLVDYAGCFGKPWTRGDGVRMPGVRLSTGSKSKTEFSLSTVGEAGEIEDAGEFGSYGKGGGYTGNGANLLIVDDMLKEKEVDSEAMIADAHAAVQSLASRLDPEGISIWIVVNTRYRENDVVGHVLADYQSEGPWEVVAAPLIADHTLSGLTKVKGAAEGDGASDEDGPVVVEVQATIADHYLPPCVELDGTVLVGESWHRPDGDVLAPYTEAVALRKREGLLKRKPQEWWGQYQCTPVAASGNMVDPAWLRTYAGEQFDRRRYARIVISGDTGDGKNLAAARSAFGVYGEILPAWNKCSVCAGVGSIGWLGGQGGANQNALQSNPRAGRAPLNTHSPPRNASSNIAAHTTLACEACQGTGHGPPVRLLELVAFPWQQPDQVAVLKALAKRWAPNLIIIEDKSTGPSVAQHLRRDQDWARVPVHLVEPCGNKPVRMAAASPSLRDGDLGLPADCRAVAPSWQGVGYERGADWGADLRAELLHFPHGRYKDRADQLSQYLNWRLLNALPAGVLRLEREGEQARVPLGEQSRRVSAAISGKAYAAF